MDRVMVVKKGNNTSEGKVAKGSTRARQTGGASENTALVDKNCNVLPVESKRNREDVQEKRQGLRTAVEASDTAAKETKSLAANGGELLSRYTASDGTMYEVDDCVYIDSQRPDVPYFVCAIKEFRRCKRECIYVGVKWFYRPSEVPESVYQLLVQDRNTENGSRDHILEDPSVKERELFVSDAVDTYSVIALRGKCRVKCLSEVSCLREFISGSDHFFYVLRYNPETRRLANHKGEIRVGPSHQVVLPECQSKDLANMKYGSPKEELMWRPTLEDYDLMMFVGAARSMAQYAGICKEGDTNKGLSVAARDATTINALRVLHDNKYDTAQALQALVKRPFPKSSQNWSDDDTKKFVKGLRQFGKNFYKIKKEHLPHKETSELVEYYYIWKKTASALASRPHRRRRHNVLRRRNSTRNAKSSSSEFVELSSCSEEEYDSEDSEKDFSLYCCRHCYTSNSKSWHHGGYDRLILCTECLAYFKKYGVMRKVAEARDPPPYMFKVVMEKENDVDYYVNGKQLRSRRSTPNMSTSLRYGRSKTNSPLDALISRDSPIPGRKLTRLTKPGSPSGASTGSNTSSSSSNKKTQQTKRRRTKRTTTEASQEKVLPPKRKKSVTQESDEEETDQSERNSTPTVDQEPVAMELADVASSVSSTGANDELTCPSPSPEYLDCPEFKCNVGKFPARQIVDGACSARTGLPFVLTRKPVLIVEDHGKSADRKTKDKKQEVEECLSQRKFESRTPSETITSSASITSHHEQLRKYMAAAASAEICTPRYPRNYPGGMPGGPMMPLPLIAAGHHGDMAFPAWQHLYPGHKDILIRPDSKDHHDSNAWYKLAAARGHPAHSLTPFGLHPLIDGQRASPLLHRGKVDPPPPGLLLPVGGPVPPGVDPITGLPHHHSHSHVHTHYHLHPGEQQHQQHLAAHGHPQVPDRSPSLEVPNWWSRAGGNPHMAGVAAHEMWLPAGHHPTRPAIIGSSALEELSPYFPGLYPPPSPRDYQLQHELMLQSGAQLGLSKMADHHAYPFSYPSSRDHLMRFAATRPHIHDQRTGPRIETELRRLEAGDDNTTTSSTSLLHGRTPPMMKTFDTSSFLMSGHKPVTIDLSKDD